MSELKNIIGISTEKYCFGLEIEPATEMKNVAKVTAIGYKGLSHWAWQIWNEKEGLWQTIDATIHNGSVSIFNCIERTKYRAFVQSIDGLMVASKKYNNIDI